MFVPIHLSCTLSRLLFHTWNQRTTIQTQTQLLTNPRWSPTFFRNDFRLSRVRLITMIRSTHGYRYNHYNNSNMFHTFRLMELAEIPFHRLYKAILHQSGCRDYLLRCPWMLTWGRSIFILRCEPRKLLHVPSRCGNGLNSSKGNRRRRLYQTGMPLVIGRWIWLGVVSWSWLGMTLIFF